MQPPQMARHQGDWARTTARVLSHLREKSRIGERTVRDQDQAAIDKVWAFVGVRIDEYDRSGQWAKVAPERREGVRQRLHDGFLDDAAFLPDGHAARKRFMRADLLKWGDRLLAEEAAKAAANAALYSFRVPFNSDAAAEAAAAILPPEAPPRAAAHSDITMTSMPEETSLLLEGLERLSARSRSDRLNDTFSEISLNSRLSNAIANDPSLLDREPLSRATLEVEASMPEPDTRIRISSQRPCRVEYRTFPDDEGS